MRPKKASWLGEQALKIVKNLAPSLKVWSLGRGL
jgi:hypothetical protein